MISNGAVHKLLIVSQTDAAKRNTGGEKTSAQ